MCFSLVGSAQTDSANGFLSESEKEAAKHIDLLKSGTLVVRLSSGEKKLAALKLRGTQEQMNEYMLEVHIENKAIIDAFKEKFDFCEVRYTYDKDIEHLLRNPSNALLIDTATLEVDSSLSMDVEKPFYILGTSRIYFETQNASSSGFVIMDKNLNYLEDPFPYYVMSFEGMGPMARTPFIMVEALMKKLTDFYATYGSKY